MKHIHLTMLMAGKSCIVRRYVHNLFTQKYKATVGLDFATKTLVWSDGISLRLQLWNISGQDRSVI